MTRDEELGRHKRHLKVCKYALWLSLAMFVWNVYELAMSGRLMDFLHGLVFGGLALYATFMIDRLRVKIRGLEEC